MLKVSYWINRLAKMNSLRSGSQRFNCRRFLPFCLNFCANSNGDGAVISTSNQNHAPGYDKGRENIKASPAVKIIRMNRGACFCRSERLTYTASITAKYTYDKIFTFFVELISRWHQWSVVISNPFLKSRYAPMFRNDNKAYQIAMIML